MRVTGAPREALPGYLLQPWPSYARSALHAPLQLRNGDKAAVGALTEHWSGNPCRGRTAKSTPCTSKVPARGDLQLSPPSDNTRSLLRNRIGQGLLPQSCWLINFQPRCQYEARTLTLLRSCTCQMLRSAQNKTAEAAQCIAACTCTAFHKSTCPMTSLSQECCVQRIPVTRAIFTVNSNFGLQRRDLR